MKPATSKKNADNRKSGCADDRRPTQKTSKCRAHSKVQKTIVFQTHICKNPTLICRISFSKKKTKQNPSKHAKFKILSKNIIKKAKFANFCKLIF